MPTTKIQQLFDHIHKLPQVPEVVRALINQLNNPNAAMLDIAKNVEKEQVISLKILRLVNSAHFGLSRKVGSISDATALLGMNQLKTLVVASGIVGSVPSLENFDLKEFWSSNFKTAELAKWFADKAKLDADIAYTAGMLAGLGTLIIQMGAPNEANEINQHLKSGHSSRLELEKSRLGYTSQAVSAELCRRWKFADELIEAIEQSGEPLQAETPNKLACTVFLGQFISQSIANGKSSEEILGGFPFEVVEQLPGLYRELLTQQIGEFVNVKSNLEGLLD